MAHYISLARPPLSLLGGAPLGTRELVRWAIDNDQRFNGSAPGIRAAVRIERALEKAKGWICIEQDGDFALLKESVETPVLTPDQANRPRAGYPINPARKVLEFVEDIMGAKEEKPEEPEEERAN